MSKKIVWILAGIVVLGVVLLLLWNRNKADKEITQEELVKSLIHISLINEGGVEKIGCGYILSMDTDKIYICSNAHVLNVAPVGTAYFYNGEKAEFYCLGYDEVHDVGIAAIDMERVSEETLKMLRCVPVSKSRWELFLQQGGNLTMTVMGKNGPMETKEGKAVALVQNKYFEDTVLQVTMPLVPGNSGSAIVDEKGYLIGMAVGQVREIGYDLEYYAAPLDDIADVYEAVTGCKLY